MSKNKISLSLPLFAILATVTLAPLPGNADATSPSVIPDYTVQAEKTGVKLVAPEKHHFNKDAPNRFQVTGRALSAEIKAKEVALKDAALKAGDTIEATAFLCDDTNTYCVRKKQKFTVPAAGKTAKPETVK